MARAADTDPAQFTEEQLAKYKLGLSDPFVVAIRTFLNTCQTDGPTRNVQGDCKLLNQFRKEEINGKFIVYWVQNHIAGGRQIAILFQENPNQIINTWVYAPKDQTTFIINQFTPAPFGAERIDAIRAMLRDIIKNPEMGI